MHGLRVLGLSLLAVVGLMALGAVGAQAAGEFYVLELVPLKLLSFKEHGMTSEPIEARMDVLVKLTVAGLGVAVGCDALELKEATASVGGFLLGKILFLACVVLDLEGNLLSKCSAQDSKSKVSTDIGTELIKGEVFLHPETSGAPHILFTADSGAVIVTIELTGAECAAKGTYPVEGSMVFSVTQGPALWMLIKAEGETLFPNDKIKFGERKTTVSGSAEIKLGAGAKLADKDWGAS
jgi:hypothetical protein